MNNEGSICLPCAIKVPRTVRQLIVHVYMLKGPSVCEHVQKQFIFTEEIMKNLAKFPKIPDSYD